MKKLVFPFLFVLIFGFSGCIKDSDYRFDRKDVAVLLSFSSELMRLTMWSPIDGYCLVSDIPEEYVEGDVLWVDYTIDMKHQEYSNVYSATKVVIYSRINSGYVKEVPGGSFTDDYTASISDLFVNPSAINKTMYFGFLQKAPAGQTFDYEMVYDSNSTEVYPTLFIRSKKTNEVTGAETDIETMYGFDMSYFLDKYKNSENIVRFYVKIFTGISGDQDVYKSLSIEPYTWELSSE